MGCRSEKETTANRTPAAVSADHWWSNRSSPPVWQQKVTMPSKQHWNFCMFKEGLRLQMPKSSLIYPPPFTYFSTVELVHKGFYSNFQVPSIKFTLLVLKNPCNMLNVNIWYCCYSNIITIGSHIKQNITLCVRSLVDVKMKLVPLCASKNNPRMVSKSESKAGC